MFDPVILCTQGKHCSLVSNSTNKSLPPLLFPDCYANVIIFIRAGFIVIEECTNRGCHLRLCADLKCEILYKWPQSFAGYG